MGDAVRRPAVAGRFYPADPGELAATVDALLSAAVARVEQELPDASTVRALVVPHAGYVYSGPVAASAYAALRALAAQPSRLLLLGPSHYVPLDGMAGSAAARWCTPLGDVRIEHGPGTVASDRVHAAEHSLEVQLPFLQRILPEGFGVLPVAVGRTTPDSVADVIDELEAALPGLMVIVSTDLSHYHDAVTAARLDRRTADAVLACDVEGIGPEDACGGWALRGLLEHARRHGRSVRLLDLRTSADTAGDPRRVVGYGAFAVTSNGAAERRPPR